MDINDFRAAVTVLAFVSFIGIVWWMRNYTIYIAAISMMTVALHGEIHDYSFGHWALLRLADTLVGLVIGFSAYWLVITLPELRKARREAAGTHPAASGPTRALTASQAPMMFGAPAGRSACWRKRRGVDAQRRSERRQTPCDVRP